MNPHAPGRPPTLALLLGLLITLATVVAYSLVRLGADLGLRRLQTELTDRNRRDSLQLLRIQNDLNQLALAMRDMLDASERYPLAAWSAQFARIRLDLDAALTQEEDVAIARRTPEQAQYLASSVAQFWDAADRIFQLARVGPRGRGASADPGVAPGPSGGAEHRPWPGCWSRTMRSRSRRRSRSRTSTPSSSGRCTGFLPPRSAPLR